MEKPDLRKLDLQDPEPPESTFLQGLALGSAIVAVPFILVVVWWVHRPLTPTEGNHPQPQIEYPSTEQQQP